MAENDGKGRILSGRLGKTILQLVVVSILVGAIFSFIGLSPQEFWRGIFHGAKGLVSRLGESFGEIIVSLATYLFIGAAIVVPIWLVARLLSRK